ncbi:MAG: DNA repair protein RecO [Candidatus Auribacterota bacterium]
MPEICETTGIVLRKFDYSNTSLIFHLFSGAEGMIHILARGAKSPKSAFRGRIELFHELRCHYLKTGSTSLYTLKECTPLTRCKSATNPDVFFLCSFIADCICSFPWESGETIEIYHVLKKTLDALEHTEQDKYTTIILYYSCRVLSVLGYMPDTVSCTRSGMPLAGQIYPIFEPVPGFALRSSLTITEQNRYTTSLDRDFLSAFESVIAMETMDQFLSISYTETVITKLASICIFFLNGLSDRKMRSFELLQKTGIISSL